MWRMSFGENTGETVFEQGRVRLLETSMLVDTRLYGSA